MTSKSTRLKIAIVGCGKVADQHFQAIQRLQGCDIVAVCDREPLMAGQLGGRYGIPRCFSDLAEMLQSTSPDVVHITTPPQSHFSLAKQCLEAGTHVYLEKPFTVNAREAEILIQLARQAGLQITAGHNYQFTLEMQEMRRLVSGGYLGARPVHLESYWSYDVGGSMYAAAFLGSSTHWLRQLPGQLFHNIISHGIAKLAEFLDDEVPLVIAAAHQSPQLSALGVEDIRDELRVFLRDKQGTTALFCFSTQFRPALNRLQIYGPANSLTVDILTGSLIRNRGTSYKSYLTYFVPPFKHAREHFRNGRINIVNFLRQRLYLDFGMKDLIEQFYSSVRTGGPPPIPYREILLTARLMDEIFPDPSGQADIENRAGRGCFKTMSTEIANPKSGAVPAGIPVKMKYVLITPARNEQVFITKTLDSMVAQTLLPERWVIVDDGSTDKTAEIVETYAKRHPWIELVRRPQHVDRSFAGKVHAFNAGFERVQSLEFNVLGNLDSDLSFDLDYLSFLMDQFARDPELGVAGTPFIENGYDSARDSFEGELHVPGGCQLFRRECFRDIGGYILHKAGGVDWTACTTARMKGWKTRSFSEKRFHHYRSLGTAERSEWASLFSYGEKDYYLGGSPIWQLFRVAYRMTKKPVILGGLVLLAGYCWAAVRRVKRPISPELMRFHRREQMKKLGAIFRSLLRFRKVDGFRLATERK